MMRAFLAPVAIALLLVAVPAAAQTPGTYQDSADDAAPGYDIQTVRWSIEAGGVEVVLDTAAPLPQDGSATVVLFTGTAGASEPSAWFIVHHGPGGDTVLAGHGGPSEREVQTAHDGATLHWSFEGGGEGDCVFVAAHTWTDEGEGKVLLDAAPSRDTDLAKAWNNGQYCDGYPHEEAVVVTRPADDSSSIPGPIVVWPLVLVAALAALRRRR